MTKRVIFIENPHIATINAVDFSPSVHKDIDWKVDPKAASAYLKENGATAEALANVPLAEPESTLTVTPPTTPETVIPVVPPGPPAATVTGIAAVNVKAATTIIETATTTEALAALEAEEKANPTTEGGRKGVLAAIAKRRTALAGGQA